MKMHSHRDVICQLPLNKYEILLYRFMEGFYVHLFKLS